MAILLFPGQGSQHIGMGKDIYESNPLSHKWFDEANEILGFNLSEKMFDGTEEDLKQTSITQPAVLVNSIIRYQLNKEDIAVTGVAGHSLGEITALIANETLSFADGLKLVAIRANAMQKACDETEGTMAAILGLDDEVVEKICESCKDIVVAANYNCPGQIVISGSIAGIDAAVDEATEKGARRAVILPVNGAFHSPLMEPARIALEEAIRATTFETPKVPVYQNVTAKAETDPELIKTNLIAQLTSSVRWTQAMQSMIASGEREYIEFGAKVLSGFMKRADRSLTLSQL